jgi:hypothetical protein
VACVGEVNGGKPGTEGGAGLTNGWSLLHAFLSDESRPAAIPAMLMLMSLFRSGPTLHTCSHHTHTHSVLTDPTHTSSDSCGGCGGDGGGLEKDEEDYPRWLIRESTPNKRAHTLHTRQRE